MSNAPPAPAQKTPKKEPARAPGAPVECRFCNQWEVAADDGYCGFCGRLLLSLEAHPESLILISVLAPHKEITFQNTGPQPLRAVIVPREGPRFAALSFEPAGTFDIPPHQEVRVHAALNAEEMPADFRERVFEYVCLVNDDPRKQLSLPVTVRSGPRPKLLTSELKFGEVQEGKAVERLLEIANIGGTPLKIRELQPEGGRLRLKEVISQAPIQPGQKLVVPVIWDSTAEGDDDGPEPEGVRVLFVNYPESLFVPARAKTFRYSLELKPSTLRLSQVLAKEDRSVRIEIENRGSSDLEIEGIEGDQPWLEVISRARSITLLCADSAGQKSGEVAPTTYARVYDFKVFIRPQGLPAGKHQGRVTVRPTGKEAKILGVEIDVVHPKEYTEYIGIDFGTTNSVVALFNQHNEIELVEDELTKSPLIPSILVFEDSETYKIGQAAKNEIGTAPDRSVRSIKRIMGYDHELEFFGRKFLAEDLAACIVRKLVQFAERKLHGGSGSYFDVTKAIITVPANFFDLQIRGILKACEDAGLDTEDDKVRQAAQAMHESLGQAVNAGVILDEPSAAILYYINHLRDSPNSDIMQAVEREEGLRLLVFDYGGGTLDVSLAHVVRLEGRELGLKILANMGDNNIGGDTIDLILMKELLSRCREQLQGVTFDTALISENLKDLQARRETEGWNDDVWREILRVRSSWKDLSEAAKIRLSEHDKTDVEILPDLVVRVANGKIQNSPRGGKLSIQRTVFEDRLQGVLNKCKRLIDSALDLAGLSHDEIDYVLHTGRQSLLKLVRDRVRESFPQLPPERDLLELEHLKVCVAKGAALYGYMRDKLVAPDARINLLSEGRRLPHSYGVEKFTNPLRPEFDEVIARGTPYPKTVAKEYGPEMIPPSGQLNLKFYQNTGTGRAIVRNPEVSQIGQFSFNTLADGEPGCVVRFVIDANRKLEVYADGQEVTIQPVRLHGEESWMG